MVIKHFLAWLGSVGVAQRMAAAEALARAYLSNDLPFEERCEAEAALTLLLDDPSSKVRAALAEALSMSPHAPVQIVHALAGEEAHVAAPLLIRSPLLTDLDLIDRVAVSDDAVQALIASRPRLSMSVSAALAEVGGQAACLALLDNDGADIASLSFRAITERHGAEPNMRERLMRDPRLPADCRHLLLVQLGEALGRSPLVAAMMGGKRAERVAREACVHASMTIIDRTPVAEHPALVEHLRLRGELSTAFVLRALACGKIDFVGACLIALTGQSEARVRALLSGGRNVALQALLRKAGLSEGLHGVILRALSVWREVAAGRRLAGTQEVSWLMLKEIDAAPGQAGPREADRKLAALLRAIHLDALRENARLQALALRAA